MTKMALRAPVSGFERLTASGLFCYVSRLSSIQCVCHGETTATAQTSQGQAGELIRSARPAARATGHATGLFRPSGSAPAAIDVCRGRRRLRTWAGCTSTPRLLLGDESPRIGAPAVSGGKGAPGARPPLPERL